MIKNLAFLVVGIATGHVLERRLYMFALTWATRQETLNQERAVGKATAALFELQRGYEIWLTTPEAQRLLEEAMGVQDKASEQAATS